MTLVFGVTLAVVPSGALTSMTSGALQLLSLHAIQRHTDNRRTLSNFVLKCNYVLKIKDMVKLCFEM